MRNQRTETPADFAGRTVRSSHQRCSIRKLFLKFRNIHMKHLCWSLFLKRLQAFRCFPVNIAKFLILPILKNICKRLLFNFLNGSLLHAPKGLLRSRLFDGVRPQGPSHRSSFCFQVGISRPEASPNLHSKI